MVVITNTFLPPQIKKAGNPTFYIMWSHLDSNQGPPDYESGALTN